MDSFVCAVDSSKLSSEYFGEKDGNFRCKNIDTSFDFHTHTSEYYSLHLDKLKQGKYTPRTTKTFKQAMNLFISYMEMRMPVNIKEVKNKSKASDGHIIFIPFFYKCPKPTVAEGEEFETLVLSKKEKFQTIMDTMFPEFGIDLLPMVVLGRPDKKDMIMLCVYGLMLPKN